MNYNSRPKRHSKIPGKKALKTINPPYQKQNPFHYEPLSNISFWAYIKIKLSKKDTSRFKSLERLFFVISYRYSTGP